MKTVEEHYNDVLKLGKPTAPVSIDLCHIQGHVLAENIVAKCAIPPFTNSAMDGFAVRATDVVANTPLIVIDDVPAGGISEKTLEPGTAIRIMTGAPLPAGADSVLQVEDTENGMANMAAVPPISVTPTAEVKQGTNVRHAGEDTQVGDLVFTPGTILTPAHVSALSALGYGSVQVYRQLTVGILATGKELKAAGEPLEPGTIPDSNSYLVSGLCQNAGARTKTVSLHSDEPEDFTRAFSQLASSCDLIVTTGGVSAGAFDVVKSMLKEQGVHFDKVAMQPGKPQGYGTFNGTPVLCLPGNPVSVFVSLHLFALPLLKKMHGQIPVAYANRFTIGIAGDTWKHKTGRDQFLPAKLGAAGVIPASAGGSGSHLVGSLPRAQFLALTPSEKPVVLPGDTVQILPFL